VSGDLGAARLVVSRSGAPGRPIEVLGDGHSTVGGITINADQVVVRGFIVVGGQAPGIWLRGAGITVQDNTVRHPTGGNFDGIQFFGTDLKILHNTISDIDADSSGGSADCLQTYDSPAAIPDPSGLSVPAPARGNQCDIHPNCMQTFATGPNSPVPDTGPSQRVLIEANRCQRIAERCLIAQGPHSRAGSGAGHGQSSKITFINNYCDAHGSSAVLVDDVQDVTIRGNEIDGTEYDADKGVFKAFAFAKNSTHATVEDNRLASGVRYEVGMDDSSRPGYTGPTPVGIP
jgi:hypothetical protein